jgi:hypothetical protein
MCSCRTKKIASDVEITTRERIDASLVGRVSFVDTSFVQRIYTDKSKLRIVESFKVTEYDKESGKPIKETFAEREVTQDTDQVVTEEESEGVTNSNDFELDYSAELNENVDVETEEESIGGQELFVKWFGIVIACFIGVILLYLLRKLRLIKTITNKW